MERADTVTNPGITGGTKLAIHGGPKAVTMPCRDRWQKLRQEEIDIVVEMMSRGEISLVHGGVVDEFEDTFARYIGTRRALAFNNGTNSLYAAYFALGVGPGDEVIVPSYTWHATVCPIIHCLGTPVFCESSPGDLCADPDDIERKITPKTKAIVVTHLWGNVADMDRIMDISRRNGIPVVEDASHAHGAEWDGRRVGSIGHIGCFSLQGSKPLAGGEAGVAVTNDTDCYERMLILGHHGRLAQKLTTDNYRHLGPQGIGFKFRPHPLSIGMAGIQLTRLDEINRRRTEVWRKYDQGLSGCPGIEVIRPHEKAIRGGFYEYRAVYNPQELDGLPLDRFLEAVVAEGVETGRDRYSLAHLNPFFSGRFDLEDAGFLRCSEQRFPRVWGRGDLPVTEDLHDRMIYLPSLTDPEPGLIEQMTAAFLKVAENADTL